jgi:hypothetical protein
MAQNLTQSAAEDALLRPDRETAKWDNDFSARLIAALQRSPHSPSQASAGRELAHRKRSIP